MTFKYVFDITKLKLTKELADAFVEKEMHGNFAYMFETFLKSVYPETSGAKLRCMTRLLNKLDVAVAEENDTIELDESEKKFLKEIFTSDEIHVRHEYFRMYSIYSEQFE
jgi:hypothetical protein